MSITSTTLAGINVWQFSGAVTDAEIKTAWAALIVNNRYKPGRYIYIDSTCSLANVRGTYYVDCEALGIILHSARNKANTLFKNWIFTQTAGLSVGARSNFVRATNGTTVTTTLTDGIDMKGGGMIYAVQGNPGGGDPRYLNEMMFGSLDGTIITSQAFAEQELQPVSYGTIWRGLNIQKCANIPIVNSGNQVVYRTDFNTEITGANPISLYSGSNGCFVSTTMRKQGATFTSSLANTYASGGVTTIMILNNWKDESYFGASKTNLTATNWSAGNKIVGGVLKKILVQPSTLIRTYDSRSTTASQKSTFSETTTDFLSGTDSTTADASTGKASIVCVGAIATGGSVAITRYTGQKFTLQKFGYKVQIETPDMTFGDDDLSAFSPITMAVQDGLARTQSAINASAALTGFQDLLEELHVLALAQVGAASYNGFNGGNLLSFSGGKLTTAFATVNVDATATSKISYNSTTNTLTIKASTLTSNSTVTEWINSGAVNLLNGAKIQGLYTTSTGPSVTVRLQEVSATGVVGVWHPSTSATELFQTNNSGSVASYDVYYPPGSVGLVKKYARELYGSQRVEGSITLAAGLNTIDFVDIPDVGIAQATLATVGAYTTIEGPSKRYDRTAVFRLTEQGIKLGQIATRSGTSLEGTFSVVVRDDAPAVYAVVGNTITIKAASYDADARFVKEVVTGGGTFTAFDTELIDINIEDSNGDSTATIAGTTGGLVDVWKCVNGTINADFATGTKIASNLSAGKFRFTGVDGYKLVFYDKNSLVAQDCSMSKGTYTLGWYIYTSPTGGLTQDQNVNFATMVSKVNDIFSDVNSVTTGFVEATDSLHALRAAVDTKPALADMEASTILANKTDVLNVTASVWSAESRTLTSAGSSGATLAEIEASTVLAKQTDVAGVPAAVRTELSTELGRVDVAVSTRSTLTAQDIPEGLTAAEVWAATERTLTETPGLPTTQAEQLRKVAQLHGVGAELVVTATNRTAGDVSQTITSTEDQTTVSQA